MIEKTYSSLKEARKVALLEIQNTNPQLYAEILRDIRKERHNRFLRILSIIFFAIGLLFICIGFLR